MALTVPNVHSSKQYYNYDTKDTKGNRAPKGKKKKVVGWRAKQF